jgi:hypothetical protein
MGSLIHQTQRQLFQIEMQGQIKIISGQSVNRYTVQPEGLVALIDFRKVRNLKTPIAVGKGAAD